MSDTRDHEKKYFWKHLPSEGNVIPFPEKVPLYWFANTASWCTMEEIDAIILFQTGYDEG